MGGALALDAAWLFAAFLVLLILAAGGIAARRFLLERGGGTVECGLRKESASWRLGVASYQREELCWFGVFGLSMRPDEIFPRRDLTVVSRRLPTQAEATILGPGMIVVQCQFGGSDGSPHEGGARPRESGARPGEGGARPGESGARPSPPAADGAPGPDPGPAGALGSAGASGGNGAPGAAGASGPGGASGNGGAPDPGDAFGPGGASGAGAAPGPGGTVELALGEAALTGLLAWLEAAPPGSHLGVAL